MRSDCIVRTVICAIMAAATGVTGYYGFDLHGHRLAAGASYLTAGILVLLALRAWSRRNFYP